MKAKRHLILCACLLVLCAAVAVWLARAPLSGWKTPSELTAVQAWRIRREVLCAAKECRELSGKSDAGSITREERDAVETRLIAAGFAALDADRNYPAFLGNPASLRGFWEAVSAGQDAQTSVLSVNEDGSLSHIYLAKAGESTFYIHTGIVLDQNGRAVVSAQEIRPIYDMALPCGDVFYYQIYPKDQHYITYQQIRLEPVNRELYDLTQSYVQSVGYQFTNLFLCSWQEGDWGDLSFSDAFEYLYNIRTGKMLDPSGFPCQRQPIRFQIPAELFEQTVMAFFAVSRETLREMAQYDPDTDSYPWRPRLGDDVTTVKYPMCQPMATGCTRNADGTLTLSIRVTSSDVTEELFSHEVTVRLLKNGQFQYVSNRVTNVGSYGLPPKMHRFALDGGQ